MRLIRRLVDRAVQHPRGSLAMPARRGPARHCPQGHRGSGGSRDGPSRLRRLPPPSPCVARPFWAVSSSMSVVRVRLYASFNLIFRRAEKVRWLEEGVVVVAALRLEARVCGTL